MVYHLLIRPTKWIRGLFGLKLLKNDKKLINTPNIERVQT
jgi:hypothetical protein